MRSGDLVFSRCMRLARGFGRRPWPVQRPPFLADRRRQSVGHVVSPAVDRAPDKRNADPQLPDPPVSSPNAGRSKPCSAAWAASLVVARRRSPARRVDPDQMSSGADQQDRSSKAGRRRMKDFQASLETLRRDATEAALIRDLATDRKKREMFDRLARHLNQLADGLSKRWQEHATIIEIGYLPCPLKRCCRYVAFA